MRFRCYALIYNEWFRDQNLIDPVYFDDGDSDIQGNNGTDYVNDVVRGSVVMNISRHRDYFSSALPGPQKGPDVLLPLSNSAPVYFSSEGLSDTIGGLVPDSTADNKDLFYGNKNGAFPTNQIFWNNNGGVNGVNAGTYTGIKVDLSSATASTINQLRTAFQLQKFYETCSRRL